MLNLSLFSPFLSGISPKLTIFQSFEVAGISKAFTLSSLIVMVKSGVFME
jgi:hypothetical protein